MAGFFILFGFIVGSVCLLRLVNWYLRLLVAAFAQSASWGLIVLLVPFGSLVFIASRWRNGGKEAFRELVLVSTAVAIGVVLFLGGLSSRMRTRTIQQSPAASVASSAEATPEPTGLPEEPTDERKDPTATAGAVTATLPERASSMADEDSAPTAMGEKASAESDVLPPSADSDHPSVPDDNAEQLREWTDSTGAFRVTAILIQVQGSEVHLQRENGRKIVVPIDRLSDTDRKYLSSRRNSPDVMK